MQLVAVHLCSMWAELGEVHLQLQRVLHYCIDYDPLGNRSPGIGSDFELLVPSVGLSVRPSRSACVVCLSFVSLVCLRVSVCVCASLVFPFWVFPFNGAL